MSCVRVAPGVYAAPGALDAWRRSIGFMLKENTVPATAKKSKKSKKSSASIIAAAMPPAVERIPGVRPVVDGITAIAPENIVKSVHPGETNFTPLDPDKYAGLRDSIAAMGVVQPVLVTRFGLSEEDQADPQKRRLVCGLQRVTAAEELELAEIPCLDIMIADEAALVAIRTAENLHRRPPSPVDEAVMVAHVVGVFEAREKMGPTAEPATEEQPNLEVSSKHAAEARRLAVAKAAQYFGRPEQWVRDRMFLTRLDEAARDLVIAGRLPLAHAREIAKLADPVARAELAVRAASNPGANDYYKRREFPMPFDELKGIVSQSLLSLAQVPWKLDVPFASAPACVECPNNSANTPGLFDSGTCFSPNREAARKGWGERGTKEPAAGVCTLASCYAKKSSAANGAVRRAAEKAVQAYQELPRKERPKTVSASLAGDAVKSFISPATVAALAKEKIAEKAPSKGKGIERDDSVTSEVSERAAAKREAEWKLQEKKRERVKRFEGPLAKWLAKVPGRWAMFRILSQDSKLWQQTQGAKGQQAINSPGFRHLVELLKEPSFEGLLEIESTCGVQFGLLDDYNDAKSGVIDMVAEVLGIEIEPAPTLESCLPAKFREKNAGGKAGKGQKAKSGVTESDLDELEDAEREADEDGDE